MREITLTLTEEEARALCPQRGAEQSADEWNRRMAAADDAHVKLKAALRQLEADRRDRVGRRPRVVHDDQGALL